MQYSDKFCKEKIREGAREVYNHNFRKYGGQKRLELNVGPSHVFTCRGKHSTQALRWRKCLGTAVRVCDVK